VERLVFIADCKLDRGLGRNMRWLLVPEDVSIKPGEEVTLTLRCPRYGEECVVPCNGEITRTGIPTVINKRRRELTLTRKRSR